MRGQRAYAALPRALDYQCTTVTNGVTVHFS
jgi:hypothetical protein